jgi:hypothetical protein
MGIHQWFPRRVLTDENKLYDFIINNLSLAAILSLSTSIRGDFLSSTGYSLSFFGDERVKIAEKRKET